MAQIGAPVAGASFVEWGAVFAGAVLGAAVSFVLLNLQAAIGLSATSPTPNIGWPVDGVVSAAALWVIAQQIGSLMIGGYVAGRVRSSWPAVGREAILRDGLHGALVWGVGLLISTLLLFVTAEIARGAADKVRDATVLNSSASAVGLILSFCAASLAAVIGGRHRDNSGLASSRIGGRAGVRDQIWAAMGLVRVAVFVPAALGFILGFIVAPLILGFRVGVQTVNDAFIDVFAGDREHDLSEDRAGRIHRAEGEQRL